MLLHIGFALSCPGSPKLQGITLEQWLGTLGVEGAQQSTQEIAKEWQQELNQKHPGSLETMLFHALYTVFAQDCCVHNRSDGKCDRKDKDRPRYCVSLAALAASAIYLPLYQVGLFGIAFWFVALPVTPQHRTDLSDIMVQYPWDFERRLTLMDYLHHLGIVGIVCDYEGFACDMSLSQVQIRASIYEIVSQENYQPVDGLEQDSVLHRLFRLMMHLEQ